MAQPRPGDEAAALMPTGFVRTAATSPVGAAGAAVRLQQDAIGPDQPRRDTIVAVDTLLVLSEDALQVDGAQLDPERHLDSTWVFTVPDAAATIRLCRASGVPAEMDVTNADERLLGAGVGSLVFNGQPIALEDARLGTGAWSG